MCVLVSPDQFSLILLNKKGEECETFIASTAFFLSENRYTGLADFTVATSFDCLDQFLSVENKNKKQTTTTTKHGNCLVLEQTGNQQDAFVPDLFGKLTGSF